ncbi:MAG TPA: DUF1254 domain-containing protein [Rubrivivax sp.]|nr:DUF1254 domain-containing protein [Rubrivivax sp.]
MRDKALFRRSFFRTLAAWTLTLTLAGAMPIGRAQDAAAPPDPLAEKMREAFVYAYPYYEFMWLRDQALHHPQSLTYTELNRFRHQRHLATPSDRWANGPIRDTFYSTAWVDLGPAPVLLSLPDTGDRYYVLVLVAADTNSFRYFGRRTSGTRARTVVLVAPDWKGEIPPADEVVRAPTRDVYINLRVLVRNEADLAAAHAVQDGFALRQQPSATAADGPMLRPIDGDVGRVLDIINEAIARDPPPASEAPLLERYREVGVCGKGCRFADLSPELQQRWRALVPAMVARFKTSLDANLTHVKKVDGWLPFRLPRDFGSNYAMRAGSAANSGGIFGVEAAEATYFMAVADNHDEPLGQGRRYRLHLPSGGLPADAFWSLTLYEFVEGGQYMVANPIGRYSVGDRTPGLVRNPDGSLDIWIQPDAPVDAAQRANWLPSPKVHNFYMNARIYQPRPEVLDPNWKMPAVQRLQP